MNAVEKKLRIIFMGTPEFAVPSLKILLDHQYQVAGVITAPDKPAGRGLQIQQSAVKKFAVENDLSVLQPKNLKDDQFLTELKSLQADLQIVVAFRMLPAVVWQMPTIGTFNLHGSLLPQYRGAAPINWAIINGEQVTGVTTFFLQQEIDTGKILFQEKITMVNGPLPLNKAPKLFTEHCLIDWNQGVAVIYNLIRGLSPYPAAFTLLKGKVMKILIAKKISGNTTKQPGEIVTDGKTYLHFAAFDGIIAVERLKMEGKKEMSVGEFLRGYRLN